MAWTFDNANAGATGAVIAANSFKFYVLST